MVYSSWLITWLIATSVAFRVVFHSVFHRRFQLFYTCARLANDVFKDGTGTYNYQ